MLKARVKKTAIANVELKARFEGDGEGKIENVIYNPLYTDQPMDSTL